MSIIGSDLKETFVTGLSDFWLTFFKDYNVLNEMGRGLESVYGQIYLDLMTQVLNISLDDAPLFSKHYWRSVLFYMDDMVPIDTGSPSDNLWAFPLTDNIVHLSFIYNKLYKPENAFELDKEYVLILSQEDKDYYNLLTSKIDPDTNYIAFKFPLFTWDDIDGWVPSQGFASKTVLKSLIVRFYDDNIDFTNLVRPDHYLKISHASTPDSFIIDTVAPHYIDVHMYTQFPEDLLQITSISYSIGTDPYVAVDIVPLRIGGYVQQVDVEVPVLSGWAPNVLTDDMTLYKNFGYLINEERPSSEEYRNYIQGIFYFFMTGSTLLNVEAGLNIVMGLPVLRNDDEVILELNRRSDDYLLITNKNQYIYPLNTPFKPEIVLAATKIDTVLRNGVFTLFSADEDTDLSDATAEITTGNYILGTQLISSGVAGALSVDGGEYFIEDVNKSFQWNEHSVLDPFRPTIREEDVLEILTDFDDAGYYIIEEIVSPTKLKISPAPPVIKSGLSYNIYPRREIKTLFLQEELFWVDKATPWPRFDIISREIGETKNNPTGYFKNVGAQFITNNVQAGDTLLIFGSPNEGVYPIVEIRSEDEIIVNATWEWETPDDLSLFEQLFAIYPAVQSENISIGTNVPNGHTLPITVPYSNLLASADVLVMNDDPVPITTTAFMPISDTFNVTDYIRDPYWWDNIIIPQNILPGASAVRRLASPYTYTNFVNNPPNGTFIGDMGWFVGCGEHRTWDLVYDSAINFIVAGVAVADEIEITYGVTVHSALITEVVSSQFVAFAPSIPVDLTGSSITYIITGKVFPIRAGELNGLRHNHAWNILYHILQYNMFFISWDVSASINSVNETRLRDLIDQGRPANLLPYWQEDTHFTDTVNTLETFDISVTLGSGLLDDSYTDISHLLLVDGTWSVNDVYNIHEAWNMPMYVGMMDPNIVFTGADPEFGDLPIEIQVTGP